MGLKDRIQHAWNAFFNNRDPTENYTYQDLGVSYGYRPDRMRFSKGNERSIVTAILNRIAVDCAAVDIRHVQLDKNGRYSQDRDSGLHYCLTQEANVDQTGRAFIQDVIQSMMDEGCVAIVPVDTTSNPKITDSFDIKSLRTGKILEWFPKHVKVRVYNELTGKKEDVVLPKKTVGIVENPFYAVMNEPNSTLQRLIRKLNLLDAIDEQSGSGKLDLIVKLPYSVKSPTRRTQAEDRRRDIETQLASSKYGIAYVDATESITQLNRPVENNLMKQIEYLTSMLYSQLSITQAVMDGTADDKTMLNYNNRTVVAFLTPVVEEMKRKFLTKTARSQNQSIMFFMDPFKLVPVAQLAEISDKLTRNEIATSNEIRQVIGWKPSDDPKADMLVNSNIAQPEGSVPAMNTPVDQAVEEFNEGGEIQNG